MGPDFVTLGKPMGNGHPVAAVITRREIVARIAEESTLFSTFGGNPVSAAAAHARCATACATAACSSAHSTPPSPEPCRRAAPAGATSIVAGVPSARTSPAALRSPAA